MSQRGDRAILSMPSYFAFGSRDLPARLDAACHLIGRLWPDEPALVYTCGLTSRAFEAERSLDDESQPDGRYSWASVAKRWDVQIAETPFAALCATARSTRSTVRHNEYYSKSWALEMDINGISAGVTLEPMLRFDVNLTESIARDPGVARELAVQWAHAMSESRDLGYSLFDVDLEDGIARGRHYSSTEMGSVSFERQLRRRLWIRSSDRFRKAQGVFWGNVFSAQMMERVGSDFINSYQMTEDRRDKDLVVPLANGAYLFLLSKAPQDACFPYTGLMPSALDRAAMLHRQLVERRLMCGT